MLRAHHIYVHTNEMYNDQFLNVSRPGKMPVDWVRVRVCWSMWLIIQHHVQPRHVSNL